ncbi:hypothetical protein PIB30_114223, partial [Stylosanthes scabra]|nr:hypothetical protein [Stylosanthes scabra]
AFASRSARDLDTSMPSTARFSVRVSRIWFFVSLRSRPANTTWFCCMAVPSHGIPEPRKATGGDSRGRGRLLLVDPLVEVPRAELHAASDREPRRADPGAAPVPQGLGREAQILRGLGQGEPGTCRQGGDHAATCPSSKACSPSFREMNSTPEG